MLYHGIDIVDIERIVHAVQRWGNVFLRRVFSDREVADSGGRAASLAARFAAKEATAKALGVGLRGLGAHAGGGTRAVGWRDIEVVRTPGGQPALLLHGRASERAAALGWQTIALSLSHARHTAIASVVAIGASAGETRSSEPGDRAMVE